MRNRAVAGLLGGACGALGAAPVVPVARGLAARVASPPLLPGVERVAGDLKAATWAEAAAVLVVVPAAALFFGLLLPRLLEARTGRYWAWPGAAFAVSLPLFRSGLLARYAVAGGMLLAALVAAIPSFLPRIPERPAPQAAAPTARARPARTRWTGLAGVIGLLLLFACGWTIYDQPGGPVDLFEDGHSLGPARAYLAGGVAYVDTYPIHGWGVDGGVDALLFRALSPTLETFRLRRAVMTALALPALATAAFLLFGDLLWAALGMLLSLSIFPFVSERQTLAFAALGVLAAAARLRRPALWFLAGVLSAWTLLFTLDLGIFTLAGGLLAALVVGLLDRDRREAGAAALSLLGGAAAGSAPFLAWLAWRGAFGGFVRVSFLELPATITDAWGLPAGTASGAIARGGVSESFALVASGSAMPALFLLLLYGLAVTVLFGRGLLGGVEPVDRSAAAALCVGIGAMRGVLGRADPGHLAFYGIFAGLPAAWLLYRAAHARRYRVPATAALCLVLAARLRPDRALATEWQVVRLGGWMRATNASQPHIPGSGRATVPAAQAGELAALRAHFDAALAPGETFFDYTNEPALYFLMDRTPPVRHMITPFYETDEKQREVIAVLEKVRPPLAILSGGNAQSPDGISNRERTPLVAAYLDRAYETAAQVAGRGIARRRGP